MWFALLSLAFAGKNKTIFDVLPVPVPSPASVPGATSPQCTPFIMTPASACYMQQTLTQVSPEAMQATLDELKRALASARSVCLSPVDQAEVARVEGCLVELDRALGGLDAEARRAAAEPRVPALRAEPSFAALVARAKEDGAERDRACEESQRAQAEGWPDPQRYIAACQAAQAVYGGSMEALTALLERHQIDLRDAAALGLW